MSPFLARAPWVLAFTLALFVIIYAIVVLATLLIEALLNRRSAIQSARSRAAKRIDVGAAAGDFPRQTPPLKFRDQPMGNHEYCVNCGESDFHHGTPCDPVKVARIKTEKAAAELMRQACIAMMTETLERFNIPFERDSQTGEPVVKWWMFRQQVIARNQPACVE